MVLRLSLGILAALALLASGQSAHAQGALAVPTTNPGSNPAHTFTLRLPNDPENLDWHRAQTMVESYLLMNMMEGLVSFDSKLQVNPALAQSWTKSEDGRIYTFKLRPGVKWSDGVPLKAQDFVFSWKRLLSPLTGALYSYFLFDIEGAEYYAKGKLTDFDLVGIKALNDSTLQVKLARPVAHWISIPAFWVTFPMRQDIVEKYGNGWEKPGRIVTIGPYQLTSQELNHKITLRKNPNYYGQTGNVDQIDALIIPSDAVAMKLYDDGKLDFLGDLSNDSIKKVTGRSELKSFQYLKTAYLGLSITKYPLSIPAVRRAISMGIDKSQLASLRSGYQPATSFVPPQVLGHSDSIGPKFDPVAGRALLRGAGFDSLKPWTIDLITQNFDKQIALADFIRDQLKKNLGLEAKIETFDHKDYRSRLTIGGFGLFMGSWVADYPDPDNFMSLFLSSSGNNRAQWKNQQYEDRVLEARNLTDSAARLRAYTETQKLLLETDAVIVPLYYETILALIRSRVQGLEINPLNHLLLRKVTLK